VIYNNRSLSVWECEIPARRQKVRRPQYLLSYWLYYLASDSDTWFNWPY